MEDASLTVLCSKINAEAELATKAEQNAKQAVLRGQVALGRQVQQRHQHENKCLKPHLKRKEVRDKENVRAQKVSLLPTPEVFKKPRAPPPKAARVLLHEAGTLTTTEYVPKNVTIHKERVSNQPNARILARREEEQLAAAAADVAEQQVKEEETRKERGIAALKRERVRKEYDDLLRKLDQAQLNGELSEYLNGNNLQHNLPVMPPVSKSQRMESAAERIFHDRKMNDNSDVTNSSEQPTTDLEEVSEDVECDMRNHALKAQVQDLRSLLEEVRLRRLRILDTFQDDAESGDGKQQTPSAFSNDDSTSEICCEPTAGNLASRVEEMERVGGAKAVEDNKWKTHVVPVVGWQMCDNEPNLTSTVMSSTENTKSSSSTVPSLTGTHTESSCTLSSQDSIGCKVNGGNKRCPISTNGCTSSSGSTSYLRLPTEIPCLSKAILADLQAIKERRQCLQQRLEAFASLPSGSSGDENKNKPKWVTSTPIGNSYIEDLKEEGSGRPLRKNFKKNMNQGEDGKKNLEDSKREVVRFYIEKLLKMRGKERAQVTASTVDGSGLSLSSLNDILPAFDVGRSSVSYKMSPSNESTLYTDIDRVPVKLRKETGSQGAISESVLGGTGSSLERSVSWSSSSRSSSSLSKLQDHDCQKVGEKVASLLQTLTQLQNLKKQLLQQHIGAVGGEIIVSSPNPSFQSKFKEKYKLSVIDEGETELSLRLEGVSNVTHGIINETNETQGTNIETQGLSYDTPSREDESSQGYLSHSDQSESVNEKRKWTLPAISQLRQIDTSSDQSNSVVSTSDSFGRFGATTKTCQSMGLPANFPSQGATAEGNHSSASSIPDMEAILERYGLTWAHSMLRTMDRKEMQESSSSSAFER